MQNGLILQEHKLRPGVHHPAAVGVNHAGAHDLVVLARPHRALVGASILCTVDVVS
jgi:hypothetical protein